jgi:ribosomal protein S21
MVRKFIKKVKREGIIEEFRSRAHFIKPTTRRAEKKRDKKRLIEKVIKREKELINPRGSFRKARRN